MNTIKSLKWRYATKKFDANKIVSQEKLDILKEAFNLTATSFGLQTLKLLIIENQKIRQKLVEHSYGQSQVIDASHLFVICIEDNIEEEDVDEHFDNVKSIRETPEKILAPYRQDLKNMMQKMSRKERQEWSANQAYIALGNLMTVCAYERIDSCPMEGFKPEMFDKILNLDSMGLKSILLLPVGYRAEDDFFGTLKKVRKSVEETVIEV